MWRYGMIVLILLVKISHQQDLCSQTILENIAHMIDARLSELDIRMNHISSTLNEVVVKQEKMSNHLEDKLPQLLELIGEKILYHLEEKLPYLLEENLKDHMEVKLSNHLEENLFDIDASIQDAIAKQDSSNQDLSHLQDNQSAYLDEHFSVVNKTLSQLESALERVKDDVAIIKNVTEKIELEAITFEENQNITSVLTRKECPESDGFFWSAGGNQCMKAFLDSGRSWADGKSLCKSQGLALAEPHDAVALQKYLVERYGGGKYYWVGGRKSGSTFKWRRGGGELLSTSPLWWTDYPMTGNYHCLVLGVAAHNFAKNQRRPYWNADCSRTNGHYLVCEVYNE
ncbi:unnamed protein product [Meganyctiphanes norvegica]|uniref:C-type lectin domain-containing protein n=1 Tax=Meganyctiphanes norvegica TaxID=48144 RepID=A0AAV2R8J7_MEGNR